MLLVIILHFYVRVLIVTFVVISALFILIAVNVVRTYLLPPLLPF